jgi:hypothetical protein
LEVEVGADINEFTRKMNTVQRKIGALAGASAGAFDALQNPFEGLDRALPVSPLDAALKGLAGFAIAGTVSNAVGILAGAIGGLASQLTAATAGLGAFAVVAVPTISNLFEMNEALKEGEMKWSELSDAQHDAIHSLRDFQGFFDGFRKQFEEPILESFSKGLEIVEDVLTDLNPLFQTSVDTVNDLMTSLSKSVNSKDMQEFFTFLNEEGAPAFETLAKTAGNFLAGFLNMMEAFGPLGVDMSEGLLGLSEDFREWAATLEENQQFQDFIKYVEEHGPQMLEDIGNIFDLLIQLGEKFAPVGAAILKFFGDWSEKQKEMNTKVENFKNDVGIFLEILKGIWKETIGEIIGELTDLWNKVDGTMEDIKSLFEDLDFYPLLKRVGIDAILGLIEGLQSVNIPTPHFSMVGSLDLNPAGGMSLPTVGVSWYKSGGIFTDDSIIGVGEAGDEAVVPLSGARMKPFADAIASQIMPRAVVGTAATSQTTNNFRGLLEGAILNVREEADIKKLAVELYEHIDDASRGA